MLPKSFDDNGAFKVLADCRQGFHLLLVSKEMLNQPPPFTPLWIFECGDQLSLNAASHWLSVRRAYWQAWGQLGENEGHQALADHMTELMAKEPIGEVVGTLVRAEPDPRVVSLGEVVATHGGPRNEILYQHRFETSGQRKRFFEWFHANSNNGSPELLIAAGLREGTGELGRLLNLFANPEAKGPKARKAV